MQASHYSCSNQMLYVCPLLTGYHNISAIFTQSVIALQFPIVTTLFLDLMVDSYMRKHVNKHFQQLANSNSNPNLCVSMKSLCELLLCHIGNNKDGLAVGNVIASGIKAADLAISYLEYQTKHNDLH